MKTLKTISNDEFNKIMKMFRSSGLSEESLSVTEEIYRKRIAVPAVPENRIRGYLRSFCGFFVKIYTLPLKIGAWWKQRKIKKMAVNSKVLEAIFASNRSELCQSLGLLCESPMHFKTSAVCDGETVPFYMRPDYSRKKNGKYHLSAKPPKSPKSSPKQ